MRDVELKENNTFLSADAFNSMIDELENFVTGTGITLDPEVGPDSSLNMISRAVSIYAKRLLTCRDTGTANNHILTNVGSLSIPRTYYNGYKVYFKAANANTGNVTVNVNSLGSKSLTTESGSQLPAGSIIQNEYYLIIYNESDDRFELFSELLFATEAQALSRFNIGRVISPSVANSASAKNVPSGLIRKTETPLSGYLLCTGVAVSRSTYADLFAAIGTTFGSGDGSTTFNIPEFPPVTTGFVSQSGVINRQYIGIAVNETNQDTYVVTSTSSPSPRGVYRRQGSGDYVLIHGNGESWNGIGVNSSNGNVYAGINSGSIFLQTGGTGAFTAIPGSGSRRWTGINVNANNGDVFASTSNEGIFKQTGGTGNFNYIFGSTSVVYNDVAVNDETGDVFVCGRNFVLKQTGGSGSFDSFYDHAGTDNIWAGVAVNSVTGDVWVSGLESTPGGITGRLDQIVNGNPATVVNHGTGLRFYGVAVDSARGNVYNTLQGATVRERIANYSSIKT